MIRTEEYEKKKRFQLRCAVVLLLLKEEQGKTMILLQKRDHTGLYDGYYDLSVCGHLEEKESLMDAVIRETKEEIGITLEKESLSLVHLLHTDFGDAEYFMPVVVSNHWVGEPKRMELDKCSALTWYPIDQLPENIIENRKQMVEDYRNHIFYRETGFDGGTR